jgi:hypothetical protein
LKPALANSSYLKKQNKTKLRKRPGGVAQDVGPEFKSQVLQKKVV